MGGRGGRKRGGQRHFARDGGPPAKRHQPQTVQNENLALFRNGLATGLLACLRRHDVLAGPKQVAAPRVFTAPVDAAPGPEEDLVEEGAGGDAEWKSSSYAACTWDATLLWGGRRVARATAAFLTAPPVPLLLPAAAAFTPALPAALLPVVKAAAGGAPQMEFTCDDEASGNIRKWLLGEQGVAACLTLDEAMVVLAEEDGKVVGYACTKEAYEAEWRKAHGADGEKPVALVTLERTMMNIAPEEFHCINEDNDAAGWSHMGAEGAGVPLQGYAGLRCVGAEGLAGCLEALAADYAPVVVTTAAEQFGKAALAALGCPSLPLLALQGPAGGCFPKCLSGLLPSLDMPAVVVDGLGETWPEDQRLHIAPGQGCAAWTKVCKSLAARDPEQSLVDALRAAAADAAGAAASDGEPMDVEDAPPSEPRRSGSRHSSPASRQSSPDGGGSPDRHPSEN